MRDISRLAVGAGGTSPVLGSEADVQKFVTRLPGDPTASLAELGLWVMAGNESESFDPELRGRMLMAADVAIQERWRAVWNAWLAPDGTPAEGRDGETTTPRLLFEIALACARGYARCLENGVMESAWIRKNLGPVMLRRATWFARSFAFANALRESDAGSMWSELHALYRQALEQQVLDAALRLAPDAPLTSIRQEYVRLLLMEIAGQDTLNGREIELAFRIAGRVAASARLKPEPSALTVYGIVPEGASRPTPVQRLDRASRPLYLDTSLCIPQLQSLLNRDPAPGASDPHASFRREFTVGETRAMLRRLIEYWGPNPPKRGAQRIALDAPVRLRGGLDSAVQVAAPLAQPVWLPSPELPLSPAGPGQGDPAGPATEAAPEIRGHLADASAAGLGMRVPREGAAWVRPGVLLAVYVRPGPDWMLGMLRRIGAEGEMLRLGIHILARRPRVGWFCPESDAYGAGRGSFSEESFLEHCGRAILLDMDLDPGVSGEALLPRGVAAASGRLTVPLANRIASIRVTEIREASEGFDRVAVEVLETTPYLAGRAA